MTKDKIIRFRISDPVYEAISKKVREKGMTMSDYSRDTLMKSVMTTDPLHTTDLLFVFAYLEYNRNELKGVCTYEVKHLIDIINKHYPDLEYELQKVFDKLILGLNNILRDMAMYKDNDEYYISFGKANNEIDFNYDLFYKYTDGRLPYR